MKKFTRAYLFQIALEIMRLPIIVGFLPSERQINKQYSILVSPILLWFSLNYATIVTISCNQLLCFFFILGTQDLCYFHKVHLHYDNFSVKIFQHSGCFHSNSIKCYGRGCSCCWGLDNNRNTTNWVESWVTDSGRAGAKTWCLRLARLQKRRKQFGLH